MVRAPPAGWSLAIQQNSTELWLEEQLGANEGNCKNLHLRLTRNTKLQHLENQRGLEGNLHSLSNELGTDGSAWLFDQNPM